MRYLYCLLFLFPFSLQAQISLPKLVSDGAVLQRDQPLKLWGTASVHERISIELNGKRYKTRADAQGNWVTTLAPHPAGGPHELTLKGKNEISIKNLLFGDVWLCSGQSNMVLNMERVKEKYPDEIATAHFPEIRNYFIKTATDLRGLRQELHEGKWEAASPESVMNFGAVSFFFAKEIYNKYQVPIGIINASVGGTPIEAWISDQGLKNFPDLQEIIHRNKDQNYIEARLQENRENTVIRPEKDRGILESPKWFEASYQPKGWRNYSIPGFWEDQGLANLDGVVWFRKEVEIPEEMCDGEAKLFMGRIVDADEVYVNGQKVGNITYQYPPRRYTLPEGLLKPGKNSIVVRVKNYQNKGGFVPDKPYYLEANGQEIDLKGKWQFKVGQVYKASPPFKRFSAQNQPTSLFNAMTAPVLAQTAIKGILWYQGESNTGNPDPYANYLKALIEDYRRLWRAPGLPFLYVQLANFMNQDFEPVESKWAELRQAQLQALELPHTAMTVAIDLGEWNDIHPLNKKDVGERLSLAARALSYGEKDLPYSGPIYRSHQIRDNKMILHFDHVYQGLKSIDGAPLSHFALAGENRKFYWAKATIVGEKVELISDQVPQPRFVRYGWANNPYGANLYNSAGLPASPFEAGRSQIVSRFSPAYRDSIRRLSSADHANMKRQLGINIPNRPGPSGNPQAPNAANSDESKVNNYVLTNPLKLESGEVVQSLNDWWEKRRPEIVEDFNMEIYGRIPESVPAVTWKVLNVKDTVVGNYPIKEKILKGIVDNSSFPQIKVEIDLVIATPAQAGEAVPLVMHFGFIRSPFRSNTVSPIGLGSSIEPTWKEQLISRGWGYATIVPSSIQADNGAGLRQGIIGLVNKGQPRKPDDWGALRAWGWGASRAMDYLETDEDVDAKRVAVEGLSRYGKAAIVTMAFDERFSLGFIGSSGAGGAKILRRVFGEQVENLAGTGEYHWFCGNFIKYASSLTPDDLPVDAHELVSLCAPRPVFISAGSPLVEGQWIDAKGMFLAGVHAGPVYRLLGKKDLNTDTYPALGTPLVDGEIAFRQHAGGHSTGPNWSTWIAWACRYWGGCQ